MLFGSISSSVTFQPKYLAWQCVMAAVNEAGGKGWTSPAVGKKREKKGGEGKKKKVSGYQTLRTIDF